MPQEIVRTINKRTRTPAEVKRLLHEIAFVLRLSRGIRMEIHAGPGQRERTADAGAGATLVPACAV